MKLSRDGLQRLLQDAVVELHFVRRHKKRGYADTRRMLCTNDFELLNSIPGRTALNFKPPTGPPPYDIFHYSRYNLVCAFDMFWQDYRMIPMESVNIITVLPTKPPDEFWKYFNEYLAKMSALDKINTMNN